MHLPLGILRPFLGARIIKTGLAVFLVLATFHWIGSPYAAFAAVAAILAVQPSVIRARQVFRQQLVANLMGGLVGALLGYFLGSTALAMAVGVIFVLGLCSRWALGEAANLAVVVVLFVMDRPEHDFLFYTLARVGAVTGGMLIGFLVNRFILPPNYTRRLSAELLAAAERILQFGQRLIGALHNPGQMTKEEVKQEAAAIQAHLDRAGYFLDLTRDEQPDEPRLHWIEKLKNTSTSTVQRILDLHRLLLEVEGLTHGPSRAAVARSLYTSLHYEQHLIARVLDRQPPDPAVSRAAADALADLSGLGEQLVAQPESRAAGLTLLSIATNLKQIEWRLDALCLLLQEGRES